MSFAIDVENPRVQQSLLLLGIQEEDLLIKTLESFNCKETPEHIQQLRYSYYVKKQEDLVKQIKSHIKQTILKEIQLKSLNPTKLSQSTPKTSSTPDPIERLSRIKEKHKEKIEKTMKSIQDSFYGLQAIQKKLNEGESLRARLRSENLNKLAKNQENKEKQLENLMNLKITERNKWKNKRNLSSITPRMSISKKVSSRKSLSAKSSESQEDIQNFMEKYQEKMKKHEEIYQQNIEKKRKVASMLSQKAENTCKAMKLGVKIDNEDVFLKLITKHKEAERKRKEKQDQFLENLEKSKQLTQEKREKASQRLSDHEKFLKKKAKAIEARSEMYSKILQQKQFNQTRQLELKSEFKRLKDEEISFNAERKKRIQ